MRFSKGYYQAFAAYFIWGIFPIYWKFLKHVPASEILSHRILWSFVFVGILVKLLSKNSILHLLDLLKNNLKWIVLLAVLIASNWVIYVYAVNANQILQGSLAYFMTPLLNIALGAWLFKEKISKGMRWAASIAGLGVFVLVVSGNQFPWIALTLATTFSFYGVVKKRIPIGGLESSFLENFVMFFPALVAALVLRTETAPSLNNLDWALLLGSGIVTATPILLFSLSARSIPFNHMGILQFLAPSLQFLIGYFVYSESVSPAKITAFILVWTGVALYIKDIYKKSLKYYQIKTQHRLVNR
ncbi:MAG: EamA family transporter RarD [Bdellovibrionales bacterium]